MFEMSDVTNMKFSTCHFWQNSRIINYLFCRYIKNVVSSVFTSTSSLLQRDMPCSRNLLYFKLHNVYYNNFLNFKLCRLQIVKIHYLAFLCPIMTPIIAMAMVIMRTILPKSRNFKNLFQQHIFLAGKFDPNMVSSLS